MKQIDIILSSNLGSIIGPVGTLKRIIESQDFFRSKGYDISVFTNESISIGPIKSNPIINNSSKKKGATNFRGKIVSLLKMMARRNYMLAHFFIKRDGIEAEALINYYISLGRTPDIVQFHSDGDCWFYLQKRKENLAKTILFQHSDGIPFKMVLQYYPVLGETDFLKQMKSHYDWTIANTDRIVFIARNGQMNFLKFYPNRGLQDTSVIINGIDDYTEEQKKIVNDERAANGNCEFKYRLCCSGTINNRKGQRIIIEALHNLPSKLLAEIHVDFMGDGGERPILEQLVQKYGLTNNVAFHGMVPNAEIYRYLARNNIYILMSKNEGLPISIIEAMRAGLPIISTNVSGIPELINPGYNGFLLDPDVDQLTNLFLKLSDYDWIQMGENSRTRYENEFTFNRMKSDFCSLWDNVIQS